MRALVLASLLAVPVSAQTVEPVVLPPPPDSLEALPALTTAELLGEVARDDAGPTPGLRPYTSLEVSAGWSGILGALGHVTGRVGVETPLGLRLGGVAAATTIGPVSTFALGPEVSLHRALGLGVQLRATGQGAFATTTSTIPQRSAYSSQRLGVSGVLEVERNVPLVGSLSLAPRAGVYGTLDRLSGIESLDLGPRTIGSAGLLLGTDVRFRALGRDWSLPITLPIPLTADGFGFDALGRPLGGVGLGVRF